MSEEISDNTDKTKTDILELSGRMIVYYIWFLNARFLWQKFENILTLG